MNKHSRFNSALILLLSLCMFLSACGESSTISENDVTSKLPEESVITNESSVPDEESVETPILGAGGGDFTIDEIMEALEYNIADIVKLEGNTAESTEPTKGLLRDDGYYVYTETLRHIEESFYPVITDNNANVAYPGGLILANNKVIDGAPQALDVKRGGSTLYLNFADGSEQTTVEVADADAQNTQAALDSALSDWYTSIGGIYRSGVHGMSYTKTPVYDAKMLQLTLGIDEAFATDTLKINFDKISSNDLFYYVIEFKEIIYVASANPFDSPEDAFDASVTSSELLNGGVNNANPPAYVNTVEYGRRVYMVLESIAHTDQLANFVNETVDNYGLYISNDILSKYRSLIDDTFISIIDTANANNQQIRVPLSNVKSTGRLEIVEFSASNPAAPLDYSLAMLKDNAEVTISGSTEYIAETLEIFPHCNIHLKHSGAYVAEFIISWEEIVGYDANNDPIVKSVHWDENYTNRAVGFETTITLNGNCRNINIEARGKTGLVWDQWRTSFKQENLPLVPNYYLEIYGTTLNQKATFESK